MLNSTSEGFSNADVQGPHHAECVRNDRNADLMGLVVEVV